MPAQPVARLLFPPAAPGRRRLKGAPFHIRSRLGLVVLFLGMFVGVSMLERIVLVLETLDRLPPDPWTHLRILGTGLVFDLAAGIYFVLPFALVLLLLPSRWAGRRPVRLAALGAAFGLVFLAAFSAVSELLFWDEFASRFNFIAVDYLVYTSEVLGNIRESYPVTAIVSGVTAVALAVVLLLRRPVTHWLQAGSLRERLPALVLLLVLPVVDFLTIDAADAHISDNRYVNELAGNGIYSFFAAFRSNRLDYTRFYHTEDSRRVAATLARLTGGRRAAVEPAEAVVHRVQGPGPEQRRNVVLITVESLSARFLGVFGNRQGLTPNLDRLAREGFLFTNLQATGTRTVRGLEAIALSVPPTPGRSIIKRPHNDHLYNIGTEFQRRGYDTVFLYGGFGYFDNMNAFFSGNGFRIVDRSDLSDDEIHFTNAWGVADEDLFDRVLKEADAAYAAGRPFMHLVMTTSNHRPYTWPEGRIDMPSGSGRDGAVKYTDYAIGRFIRQARSRPWFHDTVFVIVADHCASVAGHRDLAVGGYHIPLIFYAPGFVRPGRDHRLASQMDVAPTLLGLLHFSYESRFFGRDLFHDQGYEPRALVGNYQRLGYLRDGRLTILSPQRRVEQYRVDLEHGRYLDPVTAPGDLMEAVAYYQGASTLYERRGRGAR